MAFVTFETIEDDEGLISSVRTLVADELRALRREALVDDAVLVTSELVANAVLHAGGLAGVRVIERGDTVRIEVHDRTRVQPVMARQSTEAMTGRGLRLVASISTAWGAEPTDGGKLVWAELSEGHAPSPFGEDALLQLWADDGWPDDDQPVPRYRVSLGDVPTPFLLAAKSHVDNLVREFTLAARGAESHVSAEVPPHLASLIETVTNRFSEARQSIKRQALAAASQGLSHVRLELHLPASAADAGEDYLRALDEADSYCHAARMLTIETLPQHRLFRQWYVGELVAQLRAADAGLPPPASQAFEDRLLQEFDEVAAARVALDQIARLYEVSRALTGAATHEAVATAVVEQGVAALRASGGAVLLAGTADRLVVPGTAGYDASLVDRLRNESPDAALPAAEALRTGEPVWIESRDERDRRFPELANLERATVSMCAVPLVIGDQRLGALRFSFLQPRLFDDDERRFVLALAAQAAQALERAQLSEQGLDFSRSLLPQRIARPPRLDIAGVYHSLGDGMELGGDIYDLWPLAGGQWALAIADASGTGPQAAAIAAMVRFSFRALTIADTSPASVVEHVNRALLAAELGGAEGERFCTALFGVVAPGPTVTLTLAGGGHPAPVVRRHDGRIEEVDVGGSLLGVFEDVDLGAATVTLAPGDTVVLYTDGVVEARRDGAMFGVEGLKEAIAAARKDAAATAASLEVAVLAHTGGVVTDDLAALVIRVTGE